MAKLTENLVLARSRAPDLENVRKLNCWGSNLTDVRILRKMPNVQVVSLSVNKISTLKDFSYCHKLEELYIRKNDISNLAEICHLKQLENLRILWLSDNPCAVGNRYRMTVLKALPNLQKLDNIVVPEEEINEAIEQGVELSLDGSGDGPQGNTKANDTQESSLSKQKEDPVRQIDLEVEKAEKENCDKSDEDHNEEKEDKQTEKENINAVSLSLDETNKIRVQLGLKPLTINKITPIRPKTSQGAKARNANVLQAALCLVKEMGQESLEVLQEAVRNRLETLS